MITLKAVYSDGVVDINIPQSWHDVTFEQYCQLLELDSQEDLFFEDRLNGRIKIFTGLTDEDVSSLTITCIEHIAVMLSFSFDFNELNNHMKIPEKYSNFDIGDCTWEQLLKCQIVMNPIYTKHATIDELTEDEQNVLSGKILMDIYQKGDLILEALIGEQIKGKPITYSYGLIGFFLPKYYNFWMSSNLLMMKVKTNIQTSRNN